MSLQRWAWDRWESLNSNSGLIPKPMCSLSVRIHNLCYPNFMVHDVKTSTRMIWLQLPPHKTLLILLSHIGRCLKETMARQPQMQECDTVFSWGHCGLGERGHVCWEWSVFRFSDEKATLWTWTRHFTETLLTRQSLYLESPLTSQPGHGGNFQMKPSWDER